MSINYGDAIQKLLGVNLGKITIKVGADGEELTHETAKKKMRGLADMMNSAGKEGSYYDGRKPEDFDLEGDGFSEPDKSKKQFGGVAGDVSESSGMGSVAELFKTLPQRLNVLGLWMDSIDLQDILVELLDKGFERMQKTDEVKSKLIGRLPELKEKLETIDFDFMKDALENMLSNLPIDLIDEMDIPEEINRDAIISIVKNYTPESLQNILNNDSMELMKWLWGLVDEHIL